MPTIIISTPFGNRNAKPIVQVLSEIMIGQIASLSLEGIIGAIAELGESDQDVTVILLTGEIVTYEFEIFRQLARRLESVGLLHYLFVEEWTLDDEWFSSRNRLGGRMTVPQHTPLVHDDMM